VIVVGVLKQRSWETDQGKRSKIEIVADCIGPDLRWNNYTLVAEQGTFQESGYPAEAERKELVSAAKRAINNPGVYDPPPAEYNGEPF
jgi:single-stranded DNA-binding protein